MAAVPDAAGAAHQDLAGDTEVSFNRRMARFWRNHDQIRLQPINSS